MNSNKPITKEVEKYLNEILKRKISQAELETFLTKLYSIMEKQAQIYLLQYESSTDFMPTQPTNCFPFSNIPFNFMQYYQQNFFAPLIFPNPYQPQSFIQQKTRKNHPSAKSDTKSTKKHSKSKAKQKDSKHEVKKSKKAKKKDGNILIQYNSDNPFNGIISYLKKLSIENILNIIEITSSSTLGNYKPINIIYDEKDTKDEKSFWSRDIPDSWISIHFKKHKIVPSGYLICKKKGFSIPINWVIEASNDNENWQIINEQKDCKELNSKDYLTFDIENKESFRSIRVKMVGKNSNNCYVLIIKTFEIYGTLIPI